jgi:hypothetical protein
MIEAIPAAVKAGAEATTVGAKESLARADVGKLGLSKTGIEAGEFDIGGNYRSILSALNIAPEALGREVRGVGGVAAGTVERVPLVDSKGEVRHHISPEEAEHYEKIGLTPKEVNGRECLVRNDIDWEQRDAFGRTNLERAKQGLAPLDSEGRPYDLHHIQQDPNGMLAELTIEEHRGQGNFSILHDSSKPSEVDHGPEWDQVRADHWRARAAEVEAARAAEVEA